MTIRPLSTPHHPPAADQPPVRVAVAKRVDDRPGKRLTLLWFAGLFILVSCWLASTARGQDVYKRVPMIKVFTDPERGERTVRSMQTHVKNFSDGRESNANYVKVYFQRYLPAILTTDAYLPEAPEIIADFNTHLEKAKYNKNHQLFNRYVMEYIKPIAIGNYPPRARINAIHALANLDSRPADRRASRPPLPEAGVLPDLVNLYRDTKNPDGVRAAALHGIHRHVYYGFDSLSPQLKGGLATLMNQNLDEPIPAGRSPQAHAYLQRFAVDILEQLRTKGDSALGEKLISISTEKSRPDLIALRSAAGIGPIGSDLKDKVADPAKILDSWSRRALAVMEGELARLQALDRPEPAAGQPPTPGDADSGSSGGASTPNRPRANAFADGGGGGSRRAPTFDYGDDGPSADAGGGGPIDPFGNADVRGEGRGNRRRTATRRKDPAPGENQPPQVVASRRKLNHAFEQLKIGVTGSGTPGMPSQPTGGLYAAAAAAKPQIEQWVTMMQNIFTEMNIEYLESREDYVAALETQIERLRETLGDEAAEGVDPEPGAPAAATSPAGDGNAPPAAANAATDPAEDVAELPAEN